MTLTGQCDDKQRPKHERTLTGAWWEEDLLDSTEPLHELPVQFKSNIGGGGKQVSNQFNPSIWQIYSHGPYLFFPVTFDFCKRDICTGLRRQMLPVKATHETSFQSGENADSKANTVILFIDVVCPVFYLEYRLPSTPFKEGHTTAATPRN